MSMMPPEVQSANVRCVCCKEAIEGVEPKSSIVILALSYPERWDDDMEGLLCNECWKQTKGAHAWLHHMNIRTCTKLPGRGPNHQ